MCGFGMKTVAHHPADDPGPPAVAESIEVALRTGTVSPQNTPEAAITPEVGSPLEIAANRPNETYGTG